MKRCIICGNVGDENSTTCEVCGNPYMDITEDASDVSDEGELHGQTLPDTAVEDGLQEAEPGAEQLQEEEQSASPQSGAELVGANLAGADPAGADPAGAKPADAEPPRQPQAAGAHPVHRVRASSPQIYGQDGSVPSGAQYGPQGMVRRNVQGRPAGAAQGSRPVRQAGSSVQGRQMGQAAGQTRPAGFAQGQMNRAAGQGQPGPANPAQGRPMNPTRGQMARPVNPDQSAGGRPGMQPSGYQSRQIMEISRKMLRSPVFLLIAILHTVYLAGSIAAIFMDQMNYSQAVRMIRSMSLPAQVSGYANTITTLLSKLDSGALAANLVLHIPDILFCLGLWLIFIMAMAAKENMSGIGFGFTRATVIINMVVSCIVMLAALIVSVAVVIAAWVSGTMPVIIVSAVILVVTIVATMLVIMYHFCYLATLKICRVNGDIGEEYGKVSGFVAVVHIFMALFSVINLLSGIVNSEIANIVSAVGGIGWMLLFAVWIFMYRGKMNELEA